MGAHILRLEPHVDSWAPMRKLWTSTHLGGQASYRYGHPRNVCGRPRKICGASRIYVGPPRRNNGRPRKLVGRHHNAVGAHNVLWAYLGSRHVFRGRVWTSITQFVGAHV